MDIVPAYRWLCVGHRFRLHGHEEGTHTARENNRKRTSSLLGHMCKQYSEKVHGLSRTVTDSVRKIHVLSCHHSSVIFETKFHEIMCKLHMTLILSHLDTS